MRCHRVPHGAKPSIGPIGSSFSVSILNSWWKIGCFSAQSDFITKSDTTLDNFRHGSQNLRQEVVGNMPSLITKTVAWKPWKHLEALDCRIVKVWFPAPNWWCRWCWEDVCWKHSCCLSELLGRSGLMRLVCPYGTVNGTDSRTPFTPFVFEVSISLAMWSNMSAVLVYCTSLQLHCSSPESLRDQISSWTWFHRCFGGVSQVFANSGHSSEPESSQGDHVTFVPASENLKCDSGIILLQSSTILTHHLVPKYCCWLTHTLPEASTTLFTLCYRQDTLQAAAFASAATAAAPGWDSRPVNGSL